MAEHTNSQSLDKSNIHKYYTGSFYCTRLVVLVVVEGGVQPEQLQAEPGGLRQHDGPGRRQMGGRAAPNSLRLGTVLDLREAFKRVESINIAMVMRR